MRKFAFVLPMCAIFLAAAVLTSELGESVAASTPLPSAVPEWADTEDGATIDPNDPTAATWTETAEKAVNTRNPKLLKQKNNVPVNKNNPKK